jgi:hypothetical protein
MVTHPNELPEANQTRLKSIDNTQEGENGQIFDRTKAVFEYFNLSFDVDAPR